MNQSTSRIADRYTKERAEMYLMRWAHEVASGEGGANMLARILEAPGGGEGSRPPGGSFTPTSEKVDQILKDARAFDEGMYQVLLGKAFGLSVEDLARNAKITTSRMRYRCEQAMGALRFQLFIRRV